MIVQVHVTYSINYDVCSSDKQMALNWSLQCATRDFMKHHEHRKEVMFAGVKGIIVEEEENGSHKAS